MQTSSDLQRSADWLAPGPVDAVRDDLVGVVRQQGGRVRGLEADRFEASFGSRLAARLGGVILKPSRDRLPMKARVVVEPAADDMVRVRVTVGDDEGWNVVSLKLRDRPYSEAIDRLIAKLQHGGDRRDAAIAH